MTKELPNRERNTQTEEAIKVLRESDGGPLAHKPAGVAQATSSLNIAESLQLLQLQTIETSRETRAAIKSAVGELITSNTRLAESNDRHARAMNWLTGILVVANILLVVVEWIK